MGKKGLEGLSPEEKQGLVKELMEKYGVRPHVHVKRNA